MLLAYRGRSLTEIKLLTHVPSWRLDLSKSNNITHDQRSKLIDPILNPINGSQYLKMTQISSGPGMIRYPNFITFYLFNFIIISNYFNIFRNRSVYKYKFDLKSKVRKHD